MIMKFLPLLPLTCRAMQDSPQGPARLHASGKTTIAAPAARVWALMGDFEALKDWHPAVAESAADKGNTVGSVRVVKLEGGGEIVETLEAHDAARMSYRYRIRDGSALPVSDYRSTLTVRDEGDRSVVEWQGDFLSATPGQDDAGAQEVVTGVYQSGLAALKTLAESG